MIDDFRAEDAAQNAVQQVPRITDPVEVFRDLQNLAALVDERLLLLVLKGSRSPESRLP